MPTLAVIVILALATYRLTRLFTVDKITEPFRDAVFNWAYKPLEGDELQAWAILHRDAREIPSHVPRGWEIRTWVYDLVTCDQCLGVWWGAAVYCSWRWGGDVALGIITVAALLGAQSLFAWAAIALSKDDPTE